jgi:hypothetical protein
MFGEDHKASNYSFLQPSVPSSAFEPHNLHNTHSHNECKRSNSAPI